MGPPNIRGSHAFSQNKISKLWRKKRSQLGVKNREDMTAFLGV